MRLDGCDTEQSEVHRLTPLVNRLMENAIFSFMRCHLRHVHSRGRLRLFSAQI